MKREFSAFNFQLLSGFGLGMEKAIAKMLSFQNITSITKCQYCLTIVLGMNIDMES